MLTTHSALRNALQESHKPTGDLPPFALPRDSFQHLEVHPKTALSELERASAGFIGKKVAALVNKNI